MNFIIFFYLMNMQNRFTVLLADDGLGVMPKKCLNEPSLRHSAAQQRTASDSTRGHHAEDEGPRLPVLPVV